MVHIYIILCIVYSDFFISQIMASADVKTSHICEKSNIFTRGWISQGIVQESAINGCILIIM